VKLDFRRLMEVEREIFDLMWTELLEIQRKKKKLTRKYFRGFPLEDKLLLEIFGREHNMLQLGVEELLKSLFRAKRVY
jgi:hypothetical protein